VIADEFILDYLPDSLRNDPSFQCGGIAGARIPDVQLEVREKGFKIIQEKVVRPYSIIFNNKNFNKESGILVFSKI